jgi:DNA-binding NarL/FixJ family response regulator
MTSYRFIIVDDHPLFRGALSQALGGAFESIHVG